MKLWLTIISIIYFVLVAITLLYFIQINTNIKEKLSDNFLRTLPNEPFVSIIVPTLNEATNIEKCLTSLRSLNYSNFEIILSDGGSTDNTIEIARPFVNQIVVEKSLPKGWIGKNYGCHIGYELAKGDILLFTDADTFHKPESLRIFVSTLLEKKIGLLTAFPYQELQKWWESIVPIYFYLSNISSGGIKNVNDPKEYDSFLGIGQYLLFTREAYTKVGGHVRIKGSIIEDYAFARVVKKQLHSLYYLPTYKLVTAHMYPDSFRHSWTGFKKVLYAGTKLTPPKRILLVLITNLAIILSPILLILTAIFAESIVWPIVMSCAYLLLALTFACYWHNKGRHFWLTYLFFPFLMAGFMFTLISSTLELVFSKKTTWKGRKYEPDLNAGLNGSHKTYDDEYMKTNVISLKE
ncbi:MAG: glycosyltransferase [Candidatus Heimdallarchaeota archaeon]|nr:glycosyltransferase [Candidatus Heimdallarchaeota archaeon]